MECNNLLQVKPDFSIYKSLVSMDLKNREIRKDILDFKPFLIDVRIKWSDKLPKGWH